MTPALAWRARIDLALLEVQGEPGEEFPANPNLEAYLILLVKPDFRKWGLLSAYQGYIRYFSTIFNDPHFQIDVGAIKDDFLKKYEDEIKFFKAKKFSCLTPPSPSHFLRLKSIHLRAPKRNFKSSGYKE